MKNIFKTINYLFNNKWIKFFLFVSIVLILSFFICLIPPFFESQFDIFNSNEKTFEFINSSRSIIFTIFGFSIGFLGFSYRFVLEKIQTNYFNYILNNWVILSGSLLTSYLILSTCYLTFNNSTSLSFLYFIYFLFAAAVFSSLLIFKSMTKVLNFKNVFDQKIKNIGSIFLEIHVNNENKKVNTELEELKNICYYYIKIRDNRAEYTFQRILYYYCHEISRNQNGGLLNDTSNKVVGYAKEFFEKSMDIALSEKNTPFIIHQLNSILEIYKIANTSKSDENFNDFLIRKNIVDQLIIDNLFNNKLAIGYKGSLIFDKLIRSSSEELIVHSMNILKEMLVFELEKIINKDIVEYTFENSHIFINNIVDILSNAVDGCRNDNRLHANVVNVVYNDIPSNIYSHFKIKYKNIEKDKFIFECPTDPINLIDVIFNRLCDIHIDIIKKNSCDILYLKVPFYLKLKHFNLEYVKSNYVNLLEEVEKNNIISKFMINLLKSNIK